MTTSKLVQAPARGLNHLVPANMIADTETPLSQNVLFAKGLIKTPYGFAKLASAGLPLDGGNAIRGLTLYKEKDGSEHIVSVTTDKIYEKDSVNSTWDNIVLNDLTGNVLQTDVNSPVSFVSVAHTDGLRLDGSGDEAFYHLLVCDGGMSPIQRWAGKQETKFYSLAGGDGYHETDSPTPTDHYAVQVNMFYNHIFLVSPKTWNATSEIFEENPQTLLWGKAGKIEDDDAYDITATGAGYNELVDTGDHNVWSKQLGSNLIIYQKHSIWSAGHVGGTDVFRFRVEIPDLGLLAPHLLVSDGNRHFFIGNDFNIYVYNGGSSKQRIGDQIRDELKAEIDYPNARRCWMAVGANGSRLWIYYVPSGESYITRAYGLDLKTGAWMKRDFSHVWATGGITAVSTIGAQSYMTGETYQEAISGEQTYNEAVTATTTYRDILEEVQAEESLALGDNSGNIYQYNSGLTQDDSNDIPAYFISKVFDWDMPDTYKWWEGLTVVAKGTKLKVSYRTSDFESEDDGWTDFDEVDLTDEYSAQSFYFNETSLRVQFKFANYEGSSFYIREFKIHAPTIEGEI